MKVEAGVMYMARDKSTWVWAGVVDTVGLKPEMTHIVRMKNCDNPKLADEWLTTDGHWYLSKMIVSDRDLIAVVAA